MMFLARKATTASLSRIVWWPCAAYAQWGVRTWLLRSPRRSAFAAQRPPSDAANFLAAAGSLKVPERAVGMPYFSMNRWEKALDDSNCAAFRLAPQTRRPFR